MLSALRTKLVADFGMVLALALLCGYFTYATWGTQYRDGAAAAREVLAGLPQPPPDDGVVIVAQAGGAATEFLDALAAGLAERKVAVAARVQGGPPDLGAELRRLSAEGRPARLILATREAADWFVVRKERAATVVAPRPYKGADFLRPSNLANVADRITVFAIIGIGMTMVVLTRGIDLSVGSLVALSAVIVARCCRDYGGGAAHATAWTLTLCCAAAIVACALAGLFNGAMVTVFGVPPFIVTLAMMLVASGLSYELSNSQSINALPESFAALGLGRGPLGVPNTVWLTAALYAAAAGVMSRTVAGRHAYAIGSNPEGAYYAAVPVRRTITAAYVVSAGLAGLGGVIESSRLRSGLPTLGHNYELSVIAAVVVGGTSLSGGKGTVLGTLIGALIIAVIENGMNLTGVSEPRQKMTLGAIILGAVLLDRLRTRAGRRLA